jgi:hypothetical protein
MFLEGLPNEENFNQNDTFFLCRSSNFSNLEYTYFFINLANIDFNHSKFQLNSNNLFAFPVIQLFYYIIFIFRTNICF